MDFKILKRPAKRKPPNVPEGWRKAKRRKIRTEDQEPKMPLLETVEDPHHGQEEKENTDEPAGRLANLRSRMKTERQNVIDYMDKKRELEILADIALFWNEQEMKLNLKDGKGREHSRRKANRNLRNQLNLSGKHANLLLKDWLGWWGRMEREAIATRRQDQQDRAKLKQITFKDIIQPNLLLTGWRGWWSRMEAESKHEGSSMKHDEGWAKSRSVTNNIKKQDFLAKYFKPSKTPIQGAAGSTTTSTTLGDDKTIPEGKKVVCKPVQKICGSKLLTPKRKLHQTLDVGSPQKKIKTSPNFSRCLNFWKCKENIDTHSGPADLTVRSYKSSGGKNAKLSPKQCSSYLDFQSRGKSNRTTNGITDNE
jgi:hypothetical protein